MTCPWSLHVEGEVGRPGDVPLADLLAPHALEERVYRLRCVEAWSMLVPWIGFRLVSALARVRRMRRADSAW